MIMLIFAVIVTIGLLAVCYYDLTRFIIPNELNIGFLLLYPAFVILAPAEIAWWWSLVVMACFFGVGFLMFLANLMGGGDIKLLIVLSLWIGWDPNSLIAFGLWTALSGGILAIFLIVARIMFKHKDKTKLPKVLRWNEPLPYGLAISYAFGFLLWTGQIQGLKVN